MTTRTVLQTPPRKSSPTSAVKLQRQAANEDKKPSAPLDLNQATQQAVESTVNKEGERSNTATNFQQVLPMRNYSIPASQNRIASLNLPTIAAVAVTQELASRTAGYDPALVGKDVLQAILDEIGQQVAGESRAASTAASFATGFIGQSLLNKASSPLSGDAMVGGLKSGGLGAALSLVIPGPANEKWQVKFSLSPDFNDPKKSSGAIGISINLDVFAGSSSRKRTIVQPKLTVNTPGDVYEQEADRVAEQVMRMPEPQVQRQCACGKSSTEGECAECTKKKQEATGSLQRVASSPVGGIAAPPIVNSVLSSPGSPLPTTTRSFMESRFGQDFSQVRVHTDAQAQSSARTVSARAYTVGRHVVFGHGEFQPSSPSGQYLLAHELTHTLQQRGLSGTRSVQRQPRLSQDAGVEPSNRSRQIECVKRLGGCTNTRPAGIPTSDEIRAYNESCRAETGFTDSDIIPTSVDCAGGSSQVASEASTPVAEEGPVNKVGLALSDRDRQIASQASGVPVASGPIGVRVQGARLVLHDTAAPIGATRINEVAGYGRRSSGEGAGAYVPRAGAATVAHNPMYGPRRPTATEFEKGEDVMIQADRFAAYRRVWQATAAPKRLAALDSMLAAQGSSGAEAARERRKAITGLGASSGMVFSAGAWAVEDICSEVASTIASAAQTTPPTASDVALVTAGLTATNSNAQILQQACAALAPLTTARTSRIGTSVNVEIVQERGSDCRTTKPLTPLPAYTDNQYQNIVKVYLRAAVEAGQFPEITTHFLVDKGVGDHCDPRCFDVGRLYILIQAAMQHRPGSTYGITASYGTAADNNVWWNDTVCRGAHP